MILLGALLTGKRIKHFYKQYSHILPLLIHFAILLNVAYVCIHGQVINIFSEVLVWMIYGGLAI